MAERRQEDDSDGPKCPICLQKFFQPVRLSCGHIFCLNCDRQVVRPNKRCALCRQQLPRFYYSYHEWVDDVNSEPAPTTWYYRGRTGWWPYDYPTSRHIEYAFQHSSRCDVLVGGEIYRIDFERAIQFLRSDPTQARYIKRDKDKHPPTGGRGRGRRQAASSGTLSENLDCSIVFEKNVANYGTRPQVDEATPSTSERCPCKSCLITESEMQVMDEPIPSTFRVIGIVQNWNEVESVIQRDRSDMFERNSIMFERNADAAVPQIDEAVSSASGTCIQGNCSSTESEMKSDSSDCTIMFEKNSEGVEVHPTGPQMDEAVSSSGTCIQENCNATENEMESDSLDCNIMVEKNGVRHVTGPQMDEPFPSNPSTCIQENCNATESEIESDSLDCTIMFEKNVEGHTTGPQMIESNPSTSGKCKKEKCNAECAKEFVEKGIAELEKSYAELKKAYFRKLKAKKNGIK